MTAVMNFIRRVGRTVEKAERANSLCREHNRPAPPHAGLYCLACANPLRPDTYACPDCGTPNPVKILTNR